MKLKYELMACQDCLFLVANGDVPEDDNGELEAAIMANLGAVDVGNLCCGDGDMDDEFSWRACQCCGSSLGGSRYQLIVLECE